MTFPFFRKGVDVLKHSLFVSWLLYLSICLACVIYYWFYNWYVPIGKFNSNIIFELQHNHHNNNMNEYELVGCIELFDQHGPVIHGGQDYTFRLNLEVPESDSNFNIGLFGVTADVYNVEGKKSASFRTTSTLKYRSKLLRYIQILAQLPFFIFGSKEQKQTLEIILKDNYLENAAYARATKVILTIHDKLQFYKASLEVEANFSGLRYYMYHWYYLTSLIICSILIFITFSLFVTNSYDLKAIIMSVISKLKSKKDEQESELPTNSLDIYKKNPNSKYTFIATTARELKSLLDDEFDANVVVGIENFNQSQIATTSKKNLTDD